MDGTVEIIKEITPAVKNGGFVLVLTELVIDVLILHRFGEVGVGDTADAVRVHLQEGDAVLCGHFLFVTPVGSGDDSLDLFPVCS